MCVYLQESRLVDIIHVQYVVYLILHHTNQIVLFFLGLHCLQSHTYCIYTIFSEELDYGLHYCMVLSNICEYISFLKCRSVLISVGNISVYIYLYK